MRKAFTLIELMIVIAIIAIIAAIAVPNLLESRVTSQESAAATALKSGIFTAQVSFQAGGYCDNDGDGIGTYAVSGISAAGSTTNQAYNAMSGASVVGVGINLTLLAPTYRGATPQVSGYQYALPLSGTAPAGSSDGDGEAVWAVHTQPIDNNQGRRSFFINQAGNVYSTKPSNTVSTDTVTTCFGASILSLPASATYVPYRR